MSVKVAICYDCLYSAWTAWTLLGKRSSSSLKKLFSRLLIGHSKLFFSQLFHSLASSSLGTGESPCMTANVLLCAFLSWYAFVAWVICCYPERLRHCPANTFQRGMHVELKIWWYFSPTPLAEQTLHYALQMTETKMLISNNLFYFWNKNVIFITLKHLLSHIFIPVLVSSDILQPFFPFLFLKNNFLTASLSLRTKFICQVFAGFIPIS